MALLHNSVTPSLVKQGAVIQKFYVSLLDCHASLAMTELCNKATNNKNL